MKLDLTLTFLDLGDATSRNLEFSHSTITHMEEEIAAEIVDVVRNPPEG